MKSQAIALVATSLILSACATTGTQLSPNEPQAQITGFDETDQKSLLEQLNQGLKKEFNRFNTPVTVSNITSVRDYEKVVDGQNYIFVELHTADGKIYQTRQEPTKLSQAQRDKMKSLKGATLTGIVPIKDRPNQFGFYGLSDPIY